MDVPSEEHRGLLESENPFGAHGSGRGLGWLGLGPQPGPGPGPGPGPSLSVSLSPAATQCYFLMSPYDFRAW